MNTEAHVKAAAQQVLRFIERRAQETRNQLPAEMVTYINEVKTLPWDQACDKTMPYRIMPDQMRANAIKDKLPFLDDKEVNDVKAYLDFICNFAGQS